LESEGKDFRGDVEITLQAHLLPAIPVFPLCGARIAERKGWTNRVGY